jgi:hypothetical protein
VALEIELQAKTRMEHAKQERKDETRKGRKVFILNFIS